MAAWQATLCNELHKGEPSRTLPPVALEHALLVSLSERPATGIELTRRFDRSIGFFWRATHQQIYKVLRRMEADGWVSAQAGDGRSTERRYEVADAGRAALRSWLGAPTAPEQLRSEVAVKMRGASYGDRGALLDHLEHLRSEHLVRQAHFEELERAQFPRPDLLAGRDLDTWLVLRGGVRREQFWVEWLGDYLQAHRPTQRKAP